MPTAPRSHLIVMPRPLPVAPLVVLRRLLDRGTQAYARGAAQVLGRGAKAVARALFVVRRSYLIVAPRPLPAAPLGVLR